MKTAAQFLVLVLAGSGLFLFFNAKNDFKLSQLAQLENPLAEEPKPAEKEPDPNADLPPQKPLENRPELIKAVYLTGWSAGYEPRLAYIIDLAKKTEINAVVIDIKDYSGELSYRTELEDAEKYGKGRDLKILKPNALIKRLHDAGIYAIARQTVFQDPTLAVARKDLALTSFLTKKQWKDDKKVMWVDPAGKEVWDYNIEIAKDALARGFDEINFDYIRFPTDGNTDDIVFPFWNGTTLKRYIIRDFWKYLRKALPDAQISADLFGLTTLNYGDVGIGQNMDDALNYFNAIAPMVYPSHYQAGFDGYQNPAKYPYEVVYRSMSEANERLKHYIAAAANSTSTEAYLVKNPKLRPWLQDFDLGVNYDATKVRAQISAVYTSAGLCEPDMATSTVAGENAKTCNPENNPGAGWMLWDPSNKYTREALNSE